MWARVVEMATAIWLAVSPWVFYSPPTDSATMWIDQGIAVAIFLFACFSYWPITRHCHLLTLFIAIGLIAWGRLDGTPPQPIHQNHIIAGLFLLMIAIIPNDASQPPEVWQAKIKQPETAR